MTAKIFLAEKGYDQKYGARPLKRAIQRYIEDPLSEKFLSNEFKPGDRIVISARNGEELVFTISGSNPRQEEEEVHSSKR